MGNEEKHQLDVVGTISVQEVIANLNHQLICARPCGE